MWPLETAKTFCRLPQNSFTDLTNMLFVFGLFAVHGNICDIREARKNIDRAPVYGTNVKKEASLR